MIQQKHHLSFSPANYLVGICNTRRPSLLLFLLVIAWHHQPKSSKPPLILPVRPSESTSPAALAMPFSPTLRTITSLPHPPATQTDPNPPSRSEVLEILRPIWPLTAITQSSDYQVPTRHEYTLLLNYHVDATQSGGTGDQGEETILCNPDNTEFSRFYEHFTRAYGDFGVWLERESQYKRTLGVWPDEDDNELLEDPDEWWLWGNCGEGASQDQIDQHDPILSRVREVLILYFPLYGDYLVAEGRGRFLAAGGKENDMPIDFQGPSVDNLDILAELWRFVAKFEKDREEGKEDRTKTGQGLDDGSLSSSSTLRHVINGQGERQSVTQTPGADSPTAIAKTDEPNFLTLMVFFNICRSHISQRYLPIQMRPGASFAEFEDKVEQVWPFVSYIVDYDRRQDWAGLQEDDGHAVWDIGDTDQMHLVEEMAAEGVDREGRNGWIYQLTDGNIHTDEKPSARDDHDQSEGDGCPQRHQTPSSVEWRPLHTEEDWRAIKRALVGNGRGTGAIKVFLRRVNQTTDENGGNGEVLKFEVGEDGKGWNGLDFDAFGRVDWSGIIETGMTGGLVDTQGDVDEQINGKGVES